MQFLSILVHPRTDSDEYGVVDGAYAACWVNEPTLELAEAAARAFLEASGWDAEEVEEAYSVNRERYLEQERSLSLFDQALTDGVVVTLHTWPVGAPEDDS